MAELLKINGKSEALKLDKREGLGGEAFENEKAIIDGWDPVDLLTCCHCPSDEYDDISIELAQMLTFDTDVETLKNDIYNIFVRDFDAGTFDKSPQECETIARKIIENLHGREM